jgi:hypothetical protein
MIASLGLFPGCRSAGPSADRTTLRSSSAPAYELDAITLPELGSASVHSAYEAVARFRPDFLKPRRTSSNPNGEFPVVYVDGRYEGGVDVLRTIPVGVVAEVRYLRPVAANHDLGRFHAGGVISVRTRG